MYTVVGPVQSATHIVHSQTSGVHSLAFGTQTSQLFLPLESSIVNVSRVVAVALVALQQGALALLILKLGLPEPLPRYDTLILGLHLVSVAGESVTLLGFRVEIRHGEAAIEVRAEMVHDADGEHDVQTELPRKLAVSEACRSWLTPGVSYFEDFQINAAHGHRRTCQCVGVRMSSQSQLAVGEVMSAVWCSVSMGVWRFE